MVLTFILPSGAPKSSSAVVVRSSPDPSPKSVRSMWKKRFAGQLENPERGCRSQYPQSLIQWLLDIYKRESSCVYAGKTITQVQVPVLP